MKLLVRVFVITLCFSGCVPSSTDELQKQQYVDHGSEIEALIEQLAISQEQAGDQPIYTPTRDTPRTDKRVCAYDAAEKLKSYGKEGFPYLLKHLHDSRQSVAFRRVLPSTVGDACFCIIREQVFNLPFDYEGSIYRTGVDGESHPRPCFFKPVLLSYETIEPWLNERKNKSLSDMQIEALTWLIEEEKKIGFVNEEVKYLYLYPLERQLKEIKNGQ